MATYQPDRSARWLAAVRGGVVLMAPASAQPQLGALWSQLTADDPTSHVLDRLTAGGLAATPPFALVVRDGEAGSARIVVRGELVVHADGTAVSGSGIATWTERVLESGEVRIEAPSATGESDAAEDAARSGGLPVVEAIVPARAVVSAAYRGDTSVLDYRNGARPIPTTDPDDGTPLASFTIICRLKAE
jgi:hypothetical protein